MSTIESPRIVVIGGGSGSSTILRGLKKHVSSLTAIVTMFDSGGSSGVLRREFGLPPLGDLRQCLLALAEEEQTTDAIRKAFHYRFGLETSLQGHSVGNLLLAALTSIDNDIERALAEVSRLLGVRGRVVPVTLEAADLCAVLENGAIVRGESEIDLRGMASPAIAQVFLDHPVQANPEAVQAILEADIIILGPGDLYTSLVPNLLVSGIPEALAETRATRIYVSNLMTKLGETDGFKASDFVRTLLLYMGGAAVDWAVVNTAPIAPEAQEAYVHEGSYPVESDAEGLQRYVWGIYQGPMTDGCLPVRHDAEYVSRAVLEIAAVPATANGSSRDRGNGVRTDSGLIMRL